MKKVHEKVHDLAHGVYLLKLGTRAGVYAVYLLTRIVYLLVAYYRVENSRILSLKYKIQGHIERECMKCMIYHTLEHSYSTTNIIGCISNIVGILANIVGAKALQYRKFWMYEIGYTSYTYLWGVQVWAPACWLRLRAG